MKTLALSLLAAFACATAARADAVYDNTQTPINNATFGSSIGQSFMTGNTSLSLNGVLFAQLNENNQAYTYTTGETVSLYANNPVDNSPVTTASLASFDAPYQNSGSATEADVNATAILTANTRYWLVLSAPVATGTVYWSFANTTGYMATSNYGVTLPDTHTAYKTVNGGAPTYFDFSAGPQIIYIDADAIVNAPEPSTYATLAVGSIGAFLFLRRRARAARTA